MVFDFVYHFHLKAYLGSTYVILFCIECGQQVNF